MSRAEKEGKRAMRTILKVLFVALFVVPVLAYSQRRETTRQEARQEALADTSTVQVGGRYQVIFGHTADQDQTYLIDTQTGDVWWLRNREGGKVAVLVPKVQK